MRNTQKTLFKDIRRGLYTTKMLPEYNHPVAIFRAVPKYRPDLLEYLQYNAKNLSHEPSWFALGVDMNSIDPMKLDFNGLQQVASILQNFARSLNGVQYTPNLGTYRARILQNQGLLIRYARACDVNRNPGGYEAYVRRLIGYALHTMEEEINEDE